MIVDKDYSFANEVENNNNSLTEEDVIQMKIVKVMYGPIPDSLVEIALIK